MSSPYPKLSPTARRGDPCCGSLLPSKPDAPCGQPATWHVAWTLTQPAHFSLLCDQHMGAAQRDLAYADRHRSTIACDMPGTGWQTGNPSCCVIAPPQEPR